MRRILKFINKAVTRMDFYPVGQLLRYNHESNYRTFTGGIISLVIIVAFFIQFLNMGLKTINRQLITSSTDTANEMKPPPITFQTSPQGGFMFSLVLYGANLSDPTIKYFDISLTQSYYSPVMQLINQTVIPLVQCTHDHFNFNQEISSTYDQFGGSNWLCPPIGQSFHLQGKISAPMFSEFTITVSKCNSTLYQNCANDTSIASLQNLAGTFQLAIPFINTVINPSMSDYKQIFFEQRNSLPFTTTMNLLANGYVNSYEIITDQSVLPTTDEISETGLNIPDLFRLTYTPAITNAPYAQIQFLRSSTSVTYHRSYNKVDQYLSYVGGLVGTVLGLFFLISFYNEITYQINLAYQLFSDKSQEKERSLWNFNILYFIGILIKKVFDLCHCGPKWKSIVTFQKYRKQMLNQLDIAYLMKRLIFLQQSIQILFSPHQYDVLHLRNKITLERAKEIRQKYYFQDKNDDRTDNQIQNSNIEDNPISPSLINNGSDGCSELSKNIVKEMMAMSEQISESSVQMSSKEQNKNGNDSLNKVILEAKKGDPISKRICLVLHLQIKQKQLSVEQKKAQKVEVRHLDIVRNEHKDKILELNQNNPNNK